MHVLVVEDDALIALDLEQTLIELGHTVVAIVATAAEATARLRPPPPDLVVLDLDLGQGPDLALAKRLAARGPPFIIASGYGVGLDLPETLRHVPCLTKPIPKRRCNERSPPSRSTDGGRGRGIVFGTVFVGAG